MAKRPNKFPGGYVSMEVCKDGVVTIRTSPQQPRRLGAALPFYKARNEAHARHLQLLICKRQYNGEYAVRPWNGEVEEVFALGKLLHFHDKGIHANGLKGEPFA